MRAATPPDHSGRSITPKHTFVPYKGTSLSKILAVSSVVMVELKHVTMTRPNKIQDKPNSRPNGVLGIRSPYLGMKHEKKVLLDHSSLRNCPLVRAAEIVGYDQLA